MMAFASLDIFQIQSDRSHVNVMLVIPAGKSNSCADGNIGLFTSLNDAIVPL